MAFALIRATELGSNRRVDEGSSFLIMCAGDPFTELKIVCLQTCKFCIKTKIRCLTNRKILLNGMKLFAKGNLLLEKEALRFKLGS